MGAESVWLPLYLSFALLTFCALRFPTQRSWFLFFMTSAIFLSKYPSFFNLRQWNIDETQMIIQARMFSRGLLPWIGVDTTTSGPLNSLILTLPSIFGFEISYFTARLSASALLAGTMGLAYLRSSKSSPKTAALAFLMASALVFFKTWPFLDEYYSLHLPLFLIMISWYLWEKNPTAAMFVLGLTPWSKLQILPLALVLAYFIYTEQNSYGRRKALIAALLPSICVILFLGLIHGIKDFFYSYILMAFLYGPKFSSPGNLVHKFYLKHSIYFTPSIESFLDLYGIYLLSGFALILYFIYRSKLSLRERRFWICTFISLATMIFLPRTYLVFYLGLLIPVVPILLARLFEFQPGNQQKVLGLSFCILLFSLHFRHEFFLRDSLAKNYERKAKLPYQGEIHRLLQSTDRPRGLAVWGWAPEFYYSSDTLPATRDAIVQFPLVDWPLREYYRERFLADLKSGNPRYFLDAVGARAVFFDNRSESSHDVFPKLQEYINSNYKLVYEEPTELGLPGRRLYERSTP